MVRQFPGVFQVGEIYSPFEFLIVLLDKTDSSCNLHLRFSLLLSQDPQTFVKFNLHKSILLTKLIWCVKMVLCKANLMCCERTVYMSDFMKWLYANYIGPQVKTASQEDYEMHLSLLENCLEPDLAVSYKKTQEFTAIHAFLLGLRTGRGLPRE